MMRARMTYQQLNAARDFVAKLPLLMNEAGKVGLWRTMHKLHDAVRQAGWELAEQVERFEGKQLEAETR